MQQGCPFDIRVCIYAAEAGQLEALRFAVDMASQPLNTAVAYAAAAKDNLPCLTYMVEKVCSLFALYHGVHPMISRSCWVLGAASARAGRNACMHFLWRTMPRSMRWGCSTCGALRNPFSHKLLEYGSSCGWAPLSLSEAACMKAEGGKTINGCMSDPPHPSAAAGPTPAAPHCCSAPLQSSPTQGFSKMTTYKIIL